MRALDGGADLGAAGHIALQEHRLVTGIAERARHPLPFGAHDIGHRHFCTVAGKALGAGAANAIAAAGDQGNPTVERGHISSPHPF